MKSPKIWLAFKISAICSAVVLVVHVALMLLTINGVYLFFNTFNSEEISNVVTAVLVLFGGLDLFLLLFSLDKTKLIAVIIALVILLPLCSFLSFMSLFFHLDYTYYELTPPNGQHQIIIKEKSLLFGVFGEVYQKTSSFTMKKLGEYNTDDWPVMCSEEYEVTWQENGFLFEYYYGNGIHKTIEFEYVK